MVTKHQKKLFHGNSIIEKYFLSLVSFKIFFVLLNDWRIKSVCTLNSLYKQSQPRLQDFFSLFLRSQKRTGKVVMIDFALN